MQGILALPLAYIPLKFSKRCVLLYTTGLIGIKMYGFQVLTFD